MCSEGEGRVERKVAMGDRDASDKVSVVRKQMQLIREDMTTHVERTYLLFGLSLVRRYITMLIMVCMDSDGMGWLCTGAEMVAEEEEGEEVREQGEDEATAMKKERTRLERIEWIPCTSLSKMLCIHRGNIISQNLTWKGSGGN